ncbi:MAG: DUF1015 domain-containing protein [Calditrichaeota bacterium]|nr:DUF1015 domain-containing protein [Candidatus Cloacimonadota bacterium]MCB1047376.1 DUF1015 domain-containing protein [Calditrichota bacterium]
MATFVPFAGFRPRADLAARIASKPYDVLDSKEARQEAEGNEYSFLHVVKSEIDLPEDTNPYDDAVYAMARRNLDRMIELGRLVQDDRPCFYLYRQEMNGNIQTGVVGCVSVEEYENNTIKKHEHTRETKERDRIRHVDETNANTGPVFLTYRPSEKIDRLVEDWCDAHKCLYWFEVDGVQHEFWVVDDPKVQKEITAHFQKVRALYVADGHHRSASAAKVGAKRRAENPSHTGQEEYNFFMAVCFPSDQLNIIDYNRVVKDLNNRTEEQFLAELATKFRIERMSDRGEPWRPRGKGQFGLYLDGIWYKVEAPAEWSEVDDAVARLDVAILQEHVLTGMLGIADPRTDERIDFVGGIRGLRELERRVDEGQFVMAIAMHPTSLDDLMAVADSGRVMPPKSTWFEPKLRSGLVVHRLD